MRYLHAARHDGARLAVRAALAGAVVRACLRGIAPPNDFAYCDFENPVLQYSCHGMLSAPVKKTGGKCLMFVERGSKFGPKTQEAQGKPGR